MCFSLKKINSTGAIFLRPNCAVSPCLGSPTNCLFQCSPHGTKTVKKKKVFTHEKSLHSKIITVIVTLDVLSRPRQAHFTTLGFTRNVLCSRLVGSSTLRYVLLLVPSADGDIALNSSPVSNLLPLLHIVLQFALFDALFHLTPWLGRQSHPPKTSPFCTR